MKDREPIGYNGIAHTQILGGNRRGSGYGGLGSPAKISSDGGAVVSPTFVNVAAATTGNITLSGIQNPDGVTGEIGMPVAVRAQTNSVENGIYLMSNSGWQRITTVPLTRAIVVRVAAGTTYSGTRLVLTGATDPVINTDAVSFEHIVVGLAATNRVLVGSGPGRLKASSLIVDDGVRVQINSSDTTGIFNVSRTHATAAAGYVRNPSTGVGLLGQADGATGIGLEGYGSGSLSTGVFGHASGGIGVWGLATTGTGGYFESATGNALLVYANDSSRGLAVAFVDQHHGSNASAIALEINQAGAGDGISLTTAGGGVSVTSTGSTRGLKISRGTSGATTEVTLLEQTHTSNAQATLKITNAGTGAAAAALFAIAVGGNGLFAQSTTAAAVYAFRENTTSGPNTSADSVSVVWQKSTTDAQSALRVRNDGSGKILELQDGATTVAYIGDGGPSFWDFADCRPFRKYTANRTIDHTDWHVRFDSTSGVRTGTLPTTPQSGRYYLISRTGSNTVTVNRGGSDTINGGTTGITIGNGALWLFQYHAGSTDWYAIQIG